MLRILRALVWTTCSLLLAACGGASADPATTGDVVDGPVPGPGGGPPPPVPDAQLDTQLAGGAGRAGVAPAPPRPTEDADVVALGRALFFDRILSGNRNISCYTCHNTDHATGDALSVSIGTGGFGDADERVLAEGTLIPRNSPPLLRLAGQPTFFWDSRVSRDQDGLITPEPLLNGRNPVAADLAAVLQTPIAAQAMFPVTSPEEMRGQPGENEIADATDNLEVWRRLMRRLVGSDDGTADGIPEYRDLFARAYPTVGDRDDLTFAHAARAIAAFETSALATRGAPFDAWLAGDRAALTAEEKRGGVLFFGRAGCAQCHDGTRFTDGRHHAIGVPQIGPGKDFPGEDTGRGLVTGDPRDRYRFRTPSLRNVELTGPWMHDGAYTTLEAAVRHYIDPERSLRNYDASQLTLLLRPLVDRDPQRQAARAAAISPIVRDGVRLSPVEVAQIVAFLRTLTDPETLELEDLEPASVPSGLPIDDD